GRPGATTQTYLDPERVGGPDYRPWIPGVPTLGVVNPGPLSMSSSGARSCDRVTIPGRFPARMSQAGRPGIAAVGPMAIPATPAVHRLGGLGTAALPRLPPLPVATWYFGISLFSLRDLVEVGRTPARALPLLPNRRGRRQNGHLRKPLFDVRDSTS